MSPDAGRRVTTSGLPPAQDMIDQALGAARGECVVIVEESSEAEVRFANNTTTTNGVRRDRRVTVISFSETEEGIAAGVARRGGAIDVADLVAASERDAAESPAADDAAPLIQPASSPAPEAEHFDRGPDETDLSVLRDVLGGLSDAFARAETGGRVLAGFAQHTIDTVYLGTSTGLRRRHAQPTGSLHLVGRSTDGANSAWVGAGTPDFSDVTIGELEERLVGRLGWGARRIDLDAGRYEVVLPAEAVADFMIGLVGSASGQEAEDGRTVFSAPDGRTRVGEALSPLPFLLRSDPEEPGLTCSPFEVAAASSPDSSVFDNGLPLSRTAWVDEGRLARLRYHRAGAARSGQPVTPAIDNLVLELPGATGSVEDLVARTERGLLLTCLWYIREVDPATLLLTGLTRDGVYVIEDGSVVGAANNFRFNESPVDLLGRVTEAGATVRSLGREYGEWANRTAMPPLRVPDFNMSSVSPAS
ncbi:MAG TPA: metallopeptidase TldD-related protein [Acidimicrobiales bacterium]|nr:metallopeptidase TldD-related protein [Acidimicrobiales bacterium]